MRKATMSIQEAKQHIDGLKGQALSVLVNKGRKRILELNGSIKGTYPSVFLVEIEDNKNIQTLSCSYSDLICGDIALKIR